MNTILLLVGIASIVFTFAMILHTELMGEHMTYGECIITASYSHEGFVSSADKLTSENQCKHSCAWAGNSHSGEKQNVSCRFQTVSGYGWIASAEEFEDLIADTQHQKIQYIR